MGAWRKNMTKKIFAVVAKIGLFIAFSLIFIGNNVFANEEDFIYDDCADFSKAVSYTEGLALDVVTDDNKYAFSGDDTHIIRVTSDAEQIVYEAPSDGYFVFNTCFSPNEPISDFVFEYSVNGETWQTFRPIISKTAVESYKWIPVRYSLKKLPTDAEFIRLTFQNIGGTPWSPCLESIEKHPYNTNELGFTDCVDTKYYKSTTKLKNLGLISGYSTTEFKPEYEISRAEFCTMTAKLLGMTDNVDADRYEKIFNDISSDYWAADSIYSMYTLGVICGDENMNFSPEDNITYTDALKILVSITGYLAIAENEGGYPSGYLSMANRLKLCDSLEDISYDEFLSRGDAAILMDNALDVEIMHKMVYGEQSLYNTDGENILSQYHDIYKICGTVTDVGPATVYSEESALCGEVIVDGEKIKSGDINLTEYLGQEVTMYVKQDKSDKTFTAIYPEVKSTVKITEISYNDYIGFKDNSIIYDENNREKQIKLNDNTKIIRNLKYETRAGLIDELNLNSGYIKLISNDGSYVDYVMVYDYDTYFVPSGARLGGVFSDKHLGAINLHLDSAEFIMLSNDGDIIDYTDDFCFDDNSVISVMKSSDSKIFDIKILAETVYGTVEKSDAQNNEYWLNGSSYKASEYFISSNSKIAAGNENITAYLDINGNIAALSKDIQSEKYGYLQAVSSANDFTNDVCLRIITDSKKAIEVRANSKTELCGRNASQSEILSLSPQLIKYTLRNNQLYLASINTATKTQGIIDENAFVMNYSSAGAKYYGDGLNVFASKYQLTTETEVFVLPKDRSDIQKYEVTSLSYLSSDNTYHVEIYDTDESYRVGAVVIELSSDDGEIYNYSPIAVVSSSNTCINENGDKYLYLTLMDGDGSESNLTFSPDGATDKTGSHINGYTLRTTENGKNPFSVGEVLQYSEKNGVCSAFRLLLTKDMINSKSHYEYNLGDYGVLSEENFYSEMYSCFGSIEKKFSDKFFICGNPKEWTRSIPLTSSVLVYDVHNNALFLGDKSDVEIGGHVFVQLRYAQTSVMMLIRY